MCVQFKMFVNNLEKRANSAVVKTVDDMKSFEVVWAKVKLKELQKHLKQLSSKTGGVIHCR